MGASGEAAAAAVAAGSRPEPAATDALRSEGVRSGIPLGFPKQSRSFPPQAPRLN